MKIYCDETEREECTVCIDGKEYWDSQQFANLTQRKQGSIRMLWNKGNRIRKLKGMSLNNRVYIEAEELFNFPFVILGRPFEQGDFEEGTLMREEKMLKREPKTGDVASPTEA